ncbi:MAG TPA: hypothetical protein VN345_17125, partial [Blastocatellia bacterium]|nr:hypothetical protein [Blastocatellia bacterium]
SSKMVMKSLVFTLLAISLTLTPMIWARPLASRMGAGSAPCRAGQEVPSATAITANVTCDNDFALYVGDCCVATTFVGNNSCDVLNSCIRAGATFTLPATTGSSYIYIVAWSDASVAQGLLATFAGPHAKISTGNPCWQVYATGLKFPSFSSPGKKKFRNFLNAQLDIACSNNLWTTPAVGGNNLSGNMVPGGSGTPLEPINAAGADGTANWIWFQSGNAACAGPDSPFAPGCNHNEFLIFRFPATYL